MSDKSQGILSRWQARRQAVAAEAGLESATAQAEAPQLGACDAVNAQQHEFEGHQAEAGKLAEGKAEAEPLPDPHRIGIGGSFARFMSQEVDPQTRTAALRALWKQPQYAHIDGLIEYALDYAKQPRLAADTSALLAKKMFGHLLQSGPDKKSTPAEDMPGGLSAETSARADAASPNAEPLEAAPPVDESDKPVV